MVKRRVLVVEDDVLMQAMLSDLLQGAGYDHVVAASGEDALRLVARDPPDVALIDHHLDGMTGAELMRWLRASPFPRVRALPLIGISGRPGSEADMTAAGASCFLPKPLDETRVLDALRSATEPPWREEAAAPEGAARPRAR